jgi:hypothetical protein
VLILGVVLFVVSLALIVLKALKEKVRRVFGGNSSSSSSSSWESSSSRESSSSQSTKTTSKPHKKFFAKDEGEYVEFEEIP